MDGQKRANSVRRLKRLIIVVMMTAILLPFVLCMILFFRVRELEKEVDFLNEARLAQEVEFSLMYDTTGNSTEEMTDEESDTNTLQETVVEDEKAALADTIAGTFTEPNLDDTDKLGTVESEKETLAKKVYLTFDDGPSVNTGKILDILDRYDVKATFFVVAKQEEMYQPLYQRIVDEGHTLGLHSYSHKYGEIYASKESFIKDVEDLRTFLYDLTGVSCTFYRFPGGSSNTVSSVPMEELFSYLSEEGITYFDWNVSAKDASSGYVSADQIVQNCMDGIENFETSVVLMHDATNKMSTVEALPKLIEAIKARGDAEILPITTDTKLVQHRQIERVE